MATSNQRRSRDNKGLHAAQPLSDSKLMEKLAVRFWAILTVLIGCTIGWLIAAIDYLNTNTPFPIVALAVFYGITAWQLRQWNQLRFRIPFAISFGAILLSMLAPAQVSRRVVAPPNADLLSIHSDFSIVNWALAGAMIFVVAIICVAPITLNQGPSKTVG